ncbi:MULTISPECIES: hypothetical protein [Nitrosopumilus]|nr:MULTISPECIES: hypothetical protein [Nitrosopumilus]
MTARIILPVLVFVFALFYVPGVFAQEMLRPNDVYVDSDVQTQVPWKIGTISNKLLSFYCDKTEQSVFNLGKTTVRCVASDTEGNESRTSFVVTVGYTVVQIPDWFEHPTKYWLNGVISDEEYVASIKSLLQKNVIQIPTAEFKDNNSVQNIPIWIKQNAEKWVEHKITDDEFSIGLQWLTKYL